jgi:hypothetical protein
MNGLRESQTVFNCSKTGTAGSNPGRGMDCVFISMLCLGNDLSYELGFHTNVTFKRLKDQVFHN